MSIEKHKSEILLILAVLTVGTLSTAMREGRMRRIVREEAEKTESQETGTQSQRYAFLFEYPDGWKAACYENNMIYKSYGSGHDNYDNIKDYTDLFLGSDGTLYRYVLESEDDILYVNINSLPNQPIPELQGCLIQN